MKITPEGVLCIATAAILVWGQQLWGQECMDGLRPIRALEIFPLLRFCAFAILRFCDS
jgi:hypothetical protein